MSVFICVQITLLERESTYAPTGIRVCALPRRDSESAVNMPDATKAPKISAPERKMICVILIDREASERLINVYKPINELWK